MIDVKILVASHKAYPMPADSLYLPVQAGSALAPAVYTDWARDDAGESISQKNTTYCELTVLYWGWKNLSYDALGLVHYRRYFAGRRFGKRLDRIVSGERIASLLETTDVILPKKRHYYIESTYSQYAHAHHAADLDLTRALIAERSPGYLTAFDRVMKQTSGHRFNLFVMKRDVLDGYLTWLFGLLFALEMRLDREGYIGQSARVFGLVAERLLDVYLDAEKISYRELSVVYLEPQHWPRKILSFLKRKWIPGGIR